MNRAEFETDLVREGYEVREGRLKPNLHREAHARALDARVLMLYGSITLVFGEDRVTYGPGDSCSVPAGTIHEEHTEADGVRYVSGRRSGAEAASGPLTGSLWRPVPSAGAQMAFEGYIGGVRVEAVPQGDQQTPWP